MQLIEHILQMMTIVSLALGSWSSNSSIVTL